MLGRRMDMSARASASTNTQRIVSRIPLLAISLAALALILLAGAPLGWRIGLLPLKVSIILITAAGLLGIAAAILATLGLIFAWGLLDRPRIALLSCVVLLGVAFIAVPWRLRHDHVPPINDITTDTEHPPAIIAALAARQAEHAVFDVYFGPTLAQQQKAAYPDIVPLILTLPQARAFDLALGTAKAMPDWHIIAVDPRAGRIEATQSSFWFGFVDDVVIRVAEVGGGSRIDIRSHSRQGRGDMGVNAARIRNYIAAMKGAMG
jgi:uncharacterized protein (DUF1499 family)